MRKDIIGSSLGVILGILMFGVLTIGIIGILKLGLAEPQAAAALAPAPQWEETQTENGICWNFGQLFGNCSLKPAPSATPIAPVPSSTPISTSPVPSQTLTPTSSATFTSTPTQTSTPTRTVAPPTVTTAPLVQLSNGGFEVGTLGWQAALLAGAPNSEVERLSAGAQAGMVREGDASVRFLQHYGCFRAGMSQVLLTQPNMRLRFSAQGRAYARNDLSLDLTKDNDLNVHAALFVGLDPQGGTDPRQSSVVWASALGNPLLGWTAGSVEAFTAGNRATVYAVLNLGVDGAAGAPGSACEWALASLAGWMDAARLEILP